MVNLPDMDPMVNYIRILKNHELRMPIMNQWRFQWFMSAWRVLFTLLIWIRVKFVRTKKGVRICDILQNPFPTLGCFLEIFFWGAEVQKSQTNNGEVLRTLSSVLMFFFKTKSLPVTGTFRKVRCLELFEFSRPLNKQHTDFIIPQPFFTQIVRSSIWSK